MESDCSPDASTRPQAGLAQNSLVRTVWQSPHLYPLEPVFGLSQVKASKIVLRLDFDVNLWVILPASLLVLRYRLDNQGEQYRHTFLHVWEIYKRRSAWFPLYRLLNGKILASAKQVHPSVGKHIHVGGEFA